MPPLPPGTCHFPGCTDPAGSDGFCGGHCRPAQLAPSRRLCSTPGCEEPVLNDGTCCGTHSAGRLVTVECDPSDGAKLSHCGYRLLDSTMDPDTGQIVQVWAIVKTDEGC